MEISGGTVIDQKPAAVFELLQLEAMLPAAEAAVRCGGCDGCKGCAH
jgi:hypothetical protein